MSPTIILKGCMAMLIDVSSSMSITRPNAMAALIVKPRLPELGRKAMTATATSAPR